MADWADIANLWWLKQQPQPSSSLPAFELGARMQQQRIQNDIETKKMALDQQYRMDHLRTQDRVATAQIERYGAIAKERKDEEDDLQAMQPAINALSRGEAPVVPPWKSFRGAQAWSDIYTAISRNNAQKNLTAAQKQNNMSYDNMAARVVANAKINGKPDPDAVLASELGLANKDGWDLQSASKILELDRKWNKPEGLQATQVTTRTPAGTTTWGLPPGQTPTPLLKDLEAADRFAKEARTALQAGDTQTANELLDKSKALRQAHAAKGQQITVNSQTGEVSITSGPISTLTSPVQTQIQQRALAGEKLISMGSELMSKVSGANLGVAGNVNQIRNELLGQIPGMNWQYKEGVTDFRTLLRVFNENAMRALQTADPRMSDRDAKRFEAILPKLGVLENQRTFQEKISTFKDSMRKMVRADSETAKVPIPDWALTIEELAAKVKSGEMPSARAEEILTKYY